ncbi:hypothetical protein MRQ36_12980 [Micromonospora sp. R77]|uniref:hypothetical protein n=1 Tax=Micromonospora sp. R77 TaxID=2925836 RepID=UPI001F614B6F|nr:hypothetical protein [Micromonospora sp. R77]MCI4063441.1 hypothetical protein [Micromonospora sp. R77]
MKKKLLAVAGGFLLSVGAWAVPALAGDIGIQSGVCNSNGSACSYDYSNWGGVQISDQACDSAGVYSNYYRDTGGQQTLNNYNGCQHDVQSGVDSSNRVSSHRACTNYTGPDWCSSYVSR